MIDWQRMMQAAQAGAQGGLTTQQMQGMAGITPSAPSMGLSMGSPLGQAMHGMGMGLMNMGQQQMAPPPMLQPYRPDPAIMQMAMQLMGRR